jgi:hypothetical protein
MSEIFNIKGVQRTFNQVGLPNITSHMIERLGTHYVRSNKRLIMVISHTTTHDFLLGLLLFGQSSIPITMFTHFKSPILTKFAKSIGMVTHQDGVSSTDAILKHLANKQEFGLLIALGRTRPNERLHSGYFYLAQKLQAPIIVLGFDYFLKCGTVSANSWLPSVNETYAQFQVQREKQILNEIQGICPLKPNFQVGFDIAKYPHADLASSKITAPNTGLLYAHVFYQRCRKFSTTTLGRVLLFVILVLVLLFLLLLVVYLCQE